MKKTYLLTLLSAGLIGAASAQAAVTINFQSFSDPLSNSTATLGATDGDSTAIVSSAVLGSTGLSHSSIGSSFRSSGISNSYNDWVSFTFETTTPVTVDETSFFYDYVSGNRSNRFTQVSVFTLDPNDTDPLDGITVLDSVTLGEVNTGNTDSATITSSAGAYSALDSGTLFEVRFALKSSETWGNQIMDNLQVSVAPVPEPSTYALALGFLALGGVMIRRRLKA